MAVVFVKRKIFLILFLLALSLSSFIVLKSFNTASSKIISGEQCIDCNAEQKEPIKTDVFVYDKEVIVIPTKEEHGVEANSQIEGCVVESSDIFDKDILKYIVDFGKHECEADATQLRTSISEGNLEIVGKSLEYVKLRNIHSDKENGYVYDDTHDLFQSRMKSKLTKGTLVMLRNEISARYIIPMHDKYSSKTPISLIFASESSTERGLFLYHESGYLRHNSSGLCISLLENIPVDNAKLVLSTDCSLKFSFIKNGVMNLDGSEFCVHPLWGGQIPEEKQELCLWRACDETARLQYHNFKLHEGEKINITTRLTNEIVELDFKHVNRKKEESVLLLNFTPQKMSSHVFIRETVSVYVITVDEISGGHFQRKLPSSYKYMKDNMAFNMMNMYASTNDVLSDNMLVIINGNLRNNSDGEKNLFDVAKSENYATMFSMDDVSSISADIRAYHNAAPYFQVIDQKHGKEKMCINSQPIYDASFSYLKSFISAYPNNPKLGIIGLSKITKSNFNIVGYMDNSLKETLEFLSKLPQTLVVVHSIKGSLTGKLGQLKTGIIEHKKPLLAVYASPDIRNAVSVENNNDKLVGTYDIHVTLKSIISQKTSNHKYGLSLLEKLPDRNCAQAGVFFDTCPCT